MKLLIDTQALLWFCEGSAELSAAARKAMEDSANERFVSHATAWEVAVNPLSR
jgi:PIN domain nuclease of toxin-antitoxin system